MICDPCRVAADWIPAQPLYANLEEVAADERRQAHLLCVGERACPCQHRVRVPAEKLTEEKRRDR